MRFCTEHWTALREATAARGLSHFVAPDGAVAGERLISDGFEPLIGAHNAILANAIRIVGLGIMTNNEDGSERCPLCTLIGGCQCQKNGAQAPCVFTSWIDHAVQDQVDEARTRGLLG